MSISNYTNAQLGFLALCMSTCISLPTFSVAETIHKEDKFGNNVRKNIIQKKKLLSQKAQKTFTPTPTAETLIVTGSRGGDKKARQSISPITVVSAATLRRSGQMNIADALARVYPSINISARNTDTAQLTSSIRMRGLNPNEVLVLVDGKRRHVTSNMTINAGPQFGATPVDLNMIPANSIDHIEVLEDGAAAMYGSDAIAGVVNIITKKSSKGINVSAQTGANAYNGDGWQYQLSGDGGVKIGETGYLHLSGQMYHTDHFSAKTKDHRLLGYWPKNAYTGGYYTGVVPNAISVPTTSNKITSTPEETRENFAADFGAELTQKINFYGFITYAHRHAQAYENYRIPSISATYYPYGFIPEETIEENDYSALLGIKGRNFLGFDWDLSTVYGADEADFGITNTVNTGMLSSSCNNGNVGNYSTDGCGWSPTTTRLQTYRHSEWTNNLDFKRKFNIDKNIPTMIAFGGEHRLEDYTIKAGNPPSYEAGGTQGAVGIRPASAGTWGRDIWSAYVDVNFKFFKKLEIDTAGRFEHYTDVGNTETGKISARYDITSWLALRSTISTGFRAPTLAEQHYSSVATGPTSASGVLPVSSAAARSLGASALKPERSTNVSGGIVMEPARNFYIETDVYQINLRDRIVAGGTTTGLDAYNAIQELGYNISNITDMNSVKAYYFANGASTRTQGLDIKTQYKFEFGRFGNLNLSLALDLNRTRLTHNGIGSNGKPFLNEQTISYITTETPRSKIILNAYYNIGKWDFNIRQARYGETTGMLTYQDWTPTNLNCPRGGSLRASNSCFQQFKNSPRWLTDIEIGYAIDKKWHLAIGANNLFNIRPRQVSDRIKANYGAAIYDTTSSQVPITGGYYYGRINAQF